MCENHRDVDKCYEDKTIKENKDSLTVIYLTVIYIMEIKSKKMRTTLLLFISPTLTKASSFHILI